MVELGNFSVSSKQQDVVWAERNLNSQQTRVGEAVKTYDYWKQQSNDRLQEANDFQISHQSKFQEVWERQEKGELIWGRDPSGSYQ